MRLAGVDVSDSTAARLAALLHRKGEAGLALEIGLAIDHMRSDVRLSDRDRQVILFALDLPTQLARDLRDVLLDEQHGPEQGSAARLAIDTPHAHTEVAGGLPRAGNQPASQR